MLPFAASAASSLDHAWVPEAAPKPMEPRSLDDVSALETFIDGIINVQLDNMKIAGATVSIVKDGEVLFAKGYGWEDIENEIPVDAEMSLFRPGSVSKLFTWTAVMQMVEQGKLDLDVDVNTYLTQFKIPATFDAPITLRNIMTHSTGFEDGALGFLIRFSEDELIPMVDALPMHMPARVKPPVVDFTNGTTAAYSNWATALAGLIVSNVSGMPFEAYVERNIFEPLGMTRSSFVEPLPSELRERLATGYRYQNGEFEPRPEEYLSNFAPAGSLSTTAADMAKFMLAHLQGGILNGNRILKEETVALMHSRTLSPDPHVNGMALGFYETYINGRRTIGHGGSTVDFKTEMFLLKEEGLGFFVSYNSPPGGFAHQSLKQVFMDYYYPAEIPEIESIEGFEARAADFAGSYRLTRRAHTTIEKVISALGDIKVAPMPDRTLLISNLMAETKRWVEIAPGVFREKSGHEVVAFKRDEAGDVVGLVGPFGVMPAEKISWWQTGAFHGLVVGLSVVLFISMLANAFYRRKDDRVKAAPYQYGRWAITTAGAMNLVFLVALVLAVSTGEAALLEGFPGFFKAALVLPMISVLLTIVAFAVAVQAWRKGTDGRAGRIHYSLVTLAGVLFLWSMNYWNLLGFHFG
jgi:CubicO group peptidase (beta-lactamase class C family)